MSIFNPNVEKEDHMKKLIFISLLVLIAFSKAAAPDEETERWDDAVREATLKRMGNVTMIDTKNMSGLNFDGKGFTTIPKDIQKLRRLQFLSLNNNNINSLDGLKHTQLKNLQLSGNNIIDIGKPDFPNLHTLNLENNHIMHVDPEEIFKLFPNLKYLNLDKNPLTKENVDELRDAASVIDIKRGPYTTAIKIIADDIGEQYLPHQVMA